MRISFLQQGRSYVVGSSPVLNDFIAPVGPNIKQIIRFSEVGADTSVTLIAFTSVNDVSQPSNTVQLKNIYDGMEFDLSSLVPAFGKDIVQRINDSGGRGGIKLNNTVLITTLSGAFSAFDVYNCPSLRIGNTGAANTFSEYNFARGGRFMTISDSTMAVVGEQAVAGFYNGRRFQGTTSDGAFVGTLSPNQVGSVGSDLNNATLSFWVRNAALDNGQVNSRLRFTMSHTLEGAVFVSAGETKLVTLKFVGASNTQPYVRVNSFGATYANFVVTQMMLNRGDCPTTYTLGTLDKASEDAGVNHYMGYLTDYRDGYFNALSLNDIGAGAGFYGDGTRVYNNTGAPFANSVFYPVTRDARMDMYLIDQNGGLINHQVEGYPSGFRPLPNGHPWALSDKAYLLVAPSGYRNLYGVERYKKKQHHEVPLESKVILRWLNSRGAWDSMYFVNFKLTPQINSTGTVDSYDFNVSVVIDWDNEEALYYLTRSPYIMALTPADVGQWGWATSESNGVFALQGGNIGKTLNLKFNYKINQA